MLIIVRAIVLYTQKLLRVWILTLSPQIQKINKPCNYVTWWRCELTLSWTFNIYTYQIITLYTLNLPNMSIISQKKKRENTLIFLPCDPLSAFHLPQANYLEFPLTSLTWQFSLCGNFVTSGNSFAFVALKACCPKLNAGLQFWPSHQMEYEDNYLLIKDTIFYVTVT